MRFKPSPQESIDLYQAWIRDHGVSLFSDICRKDLLKILGTAADVELVESVAVVGDYADASGHASMRRAVKDGLKKIGYSYPRGKRTRPELEALVEDLTPVLLFLNVPLASSELSKLVRCLRIVASELGVKGDPRDTLRSKIKAERISRENSAKLARSIALEACELLKPPTR